MESLPELLGGRPLALVMGVLEDKDAAAMLARAAAACERAWFTAPPSRARFAGGACSRWPASSASTRRACEPAPRRARSRGARAGRASAAAAVLATGSVYLVGDLLGARRGATRGRSTEAG